MPEGDEHRSISARDVLARQEATQTIVEQNTHIVREEIGHDQIGVAVSVEVADCHRLRSTANGKVLTGLKRPVPVAGKHAHAVGVGVCSDEIGDSIAVEILDGY